MDNPRVKYLVVRLSSIGDIVLTTPVIRGLKQQVEGAEVHYLVKPQYKDLLVNNPYVDKVHLYTNPKELIASLKLEHYDYVIDLHNNLRTKRLKNSLKIIDFTVDKLNFKKCLLTNFKINRLPKLHIVDRYLDTLKVFEISNDNIGLEYFASQKATVEFEQLRLPTTYIAMAIGGQHYTKKMPDELLSKLCGEIDKPIVLLGGKEDIESSETIVRESSNKQIVNLSGKISLDGSALVVKESVLLITHDTGLMHIGAAFKKIIISIWGNTVPDFGMYPYMADEKSKIFQVDDLKCRPCSKIGYKKCPKKHFKCMENQNLEEISKYALQIVNSNA